MRRELDRLELPADYELLEEEAKGTSLGWFGAVPRVVRRYRSPRPFAPTCEEIRAAAKAFSRGESRFERPISTVCNATFERRGFVGGITATSPPTPERARALHMEARDFVRVVVQIID